MALKKKKRKHYRYNDKVREEARRLYEEERWSLAQISRKKGMPNDPKTLRRWFQGMGVPLRGIETTRIHPRAKILKELRAGVDRAELKKRYGCSDKYLSQLAQGWLKV